MLALVDCNACYASCEQIYRPDLRGKPIVVLSNNDGCIITCNQEAKALNIPNLVPFFKIKPLLEKHQVQVFSSNYELYGDTSSRIMSLLENFAHTIEVYSIDEAFLDLSFIPNLHQHGQDIKRACWKEQRMPVCVGIAETKTLAKLANHIAKKSQRLEGVCVIENIPDWQEVFKKLSVNTVWGIGTRLHTRLQALNIYSVEDLRSSNSKLLRHHFGITVERTQAELNGERCIDLESQPAAKKEVFCSRSFGQKVSNAEEVQESVANYAVRATEKLRQQKSFTQRVYVTLQTSRFAETPYQNSLSTALLSPSNDSREIVSVAKKLSQQLFKPGCRYSKAGVGLLDLSDGRQQQAGLFNALQTEKSQVMMQTMDQINKKYGSGQIFIAAQGIEKNWAMTRAYKSPAYTTRLSDLPIIKL